MRIKRPLLNQSVSPRWIAAAIGGAVVVAGVVLCLLLVPGSSGFAELVDRVSGLACAVCGLFLAYATVREVGFRRLARSRALRNAALGFGLLLVIAVAPVAFEYLRPHGLKGVYGGDRLVTCACGHTIYRYIDDTGYYDYVPGHAHGTASNALTLRYPLRSVRPNEWVAIEKGTNAFRVRLRDGSVSLTFRMDTDQWYEEPRVYNLWRIWFPSLLP